MKRDEIIVGCLEFVSIDEFNLINVLAKIDTGAYSGALHCTNIYTALSEDGSEVLYFNPLGRNESVQTSKFYAKYVRSATGHKAMRYIIDTTIELKGKIYPISIGLWDRSDMKREILIGRKFLKQNNLLVDVRINSQFETSKVFEI